jgi:sulfur carrier protein
MQLQLGQRIRIVVNGEVAETGASTLAELLAELGYDGAQVATARNGDFVPRAARGETQLAVDDAIEIVAPRQGG